MAMGREGNEGEKRGKRKREGGGERKEKERGGKRVGQKWRKVEVDDGKEVETSLNTN